MNRKLGSKFDKKNRILSFFNKRKNKKLLEQALILDEKLASDEKKKKEQEVIINLQNAKKEKEIAVAIDYYRFKRRKKGKKREANTISVDNLEKEGKKDNDKTDLNLLDEKIRKEKNNLEELTKKDDSTKKKDNYETEIEKEKEKTNPKNFVYENNITNNKDDHEKEKEEILKTSETILKKDNDELKIKKVKENKTESLDETIESKNKTVDNKNGTIYQNANNSQNNSNSADNREYIEQKIINILEDKFDEYKYQLKKLDAEIYDIKKTLDQDFKKDDDIDELERQVEIIMDRINSIKKEINAIKKTMGYQFPNDVIDNYLMYLVDCYQNKVRHEKLDGFNLENDPKFKSIIDKIIEVEDSYNDLKDKVLDKREAFQLDNENVDNLKDDIVSTEEMTEKINKMIDTQTKLLEEVRNKLNETVHITERVDYISKSVNHSLLDLFLLMNVFKHNLSIKNSVIAAISAKVALDMIMKMTTPINEQVITKSSDVKDYNNLITSCLNDTNKLEDMIDNNISSIENIRYTFENTYKECSYLDSYKEAVSKLESLEKEMKDKKIEIIKMKQETERQLENNNAKVKKYNSIAA